MRTTIEIRDDLRARLLGLAAARGERGYSKIVEEALERYLLDEDRREERLAELLALRGTMSDEDAAAVRGEIEGCARAGGLRDRGQRRDRESPVLRDPPRLPWGKLRIPLASTRR